MIECYGNIKKHAELPHISSPVGGYLETACHDDNGSFCKELLIVAGAHQFLPGFFILYHNEFPWLPVAAAGRYTGGIKNP